MGFGVKNFTLLFWVKPQYSDWYGTNYASCTLFGGAGTSEGKTTNSFHCLMHYHSNDTIRFDLNYWGINTGAYYHSITAPISGNWSFICVKGYIDGTGHNLISYVYNEESTLSASNIQELINETDWQGDFNPTVASGFSIVLGQFESPVTSNFPFITGNNTISDTSKHKYVKHFGIYNSNIPYSDIVSYFNATKNNLS